MKKFSKLFIGIAAAFLAVFAGSCEIGLGEAVDTAAPTITIAYPEQSSVIRDTFIMAGECEDDMGVTNINIKIYRTDTGKSELVKTFNVSADNENKCWQAEMNLWLGEDKGYNGWELCDGKYVADVVASDESGRVSGTASLSFDIDNTAPIFILKNPTSENLSSPSAYGTTFKVAGTLSDDHTVSTMTIKIYDANADFSDPSNPPVPLETVVENNVDVTTEILVANYNKTGELKDRYLRIYDGTTEGENKNLVCTINVQDNAKEYKNPSEKENTTTGNSTNNFYITDKVSSVWTSGDMDPGRVKKVVNRTATNVSEDMTGKILNLYNTAHSDKSYFYINSDANPTYEISGYGVAQNAEITKLATTSATLTYNLTYGRNQENICPETVKVFLWGPYETAQEVSADMRAKMYSTDWDVLYSYYQTQNAVNKARVIAYNGEGEWEGKKYKKDGEEYLDGYDEGSKDYMIQSVELEEDIKPNKYYYISAYAEDLMGAPANSTSYFFAFRGQSSGAAPTVTWDDYTYGGIEYKNAVANQGIIGAGTLNFYGKVKYPDGCETMSSISYKAENAGVIKYQKDLSTTDFIGKDESNGIYYWHISIPGVADDGVNTVETIENWKITLTAKTTGGSGVSGEAKLSFTIDTKKPVITLRSLTPSVTVEDNGETKTCLNGKITIDGSLDERNPHQLWYEIWQGNNKKYSTQSADPNEENTSRNISAVIDTTDPTYKLTDDTEFIVKFYAKDKANNIGFAETKTLNNNKEFFLKQSTDKPTIKANFDFGSENSTKATLPNNSWYGETGKLNFSFSDDDGLESVNIKVNGGTETSLPIEAATTNTSDNYSVPKDDGLYKIELTATDKTFTGARDGYGQYRTESWGPYTIGVDTKAPEVTDTYSKGINNYSNTNKTLKGTATDKNGIKEIEVKITKDGAANPLKTFTLTASNVADKVTYSDNKNWSVTIPDDLIDGSKDGIYNVETTATDYAGKTGSAKSRWVIDTTPPVISSAKITSNSKTVDSNKWYYDRSVAIEVKVTDASSGISDVQYKLGDGSWVSLTQDSSDKSKWTKNVTCEQGENKIYIKATDKVGLTQEKNTSNNKIVLTANVDTEAPNVLEFVTLDGMSDTSKLINGSADNIPLVLKASDKRTGIAKVSIVSIGGTDITTLSVFAPNGNTEDKYTITIPKAYLKSGDIYVQAEDGAGNKTQKVKVATLNKDEDKPVLKNISVSPIAVRRTDSKKCLNGTITITGTIEEKNLDKVWLELYINKSNTPVKIDLPSELAINATIDTTDATYNAEGKEFDIKVCAIDKAKNEATSVSISTEKNGGTNFIVDQTTDQPYINPNNFVPLTAESHTKADITSWFNGIPLIGTVTDDDNISSISISAARVNENGTETQIAAAEQSIPTFSYSLPKNEDDTPKDGVYKVTIIATDDTYNVNGIKANRQTKMGPILVGVDTANPTVSEVNQTGTHYTKDSISLSGTTSDANGIKEIVVEVFKGVETTATKTYKYSESKVTYPVQGTTDGWSCTIPDADLLEGDYKIKTTVTDYANKNNSVTSNYIKDKTAPTISPSITTSVTKSITKDSETQKWFNDSSINIKAVVTDTISGVSNVQYSLDGNEWTSLKQGTTDATKNNWTATVKCAQGKNTIQIKAVDKSNLNSATNNKLVAYVDSIAPSISISDSSTRIVNTKSAITFKAIVTDTGAGVDTIANSGVVISQINGTTPVAGVIKAKSVSGNEYTFEIPTGSIKTGKVKVTAKDVLGTSTSEELFSLTVDNDDPDVQVKTVTPVITKVENETTKFFVNGTIKITGIANDLNMEKVWYKVKVNGTEETTEHELTDGVSIEIDTTNYSDNSELDLTVYAKDKAGNSKSATASSVYGTTKFIVDQTTDKPEISPSNITYLAAPSAGTAATAASIDESAWFTGTGDNNVIGTVSDDDILSSVTIVAKDKSGKAISGINSQQYISNGSTASSINFSYTLPSSDGIYQVTIYAEDNTYNVGGITANRSETYGPFVVGVDKTAPTITENNPAGTNYIANSDITLSGTVNDANGIKEIKIEVFKNGAATAIKEYTYLASNGTNTITYPVSGTSNGWKYVIPKADLTDGKYRITVTAKDYAGLTSSVERNFVKDNKKPDVSASVTTPINPTTISENATSTKWYGTGSLTITATAKDETCDVTDVSYSFDKTNWTPLKQDTDDKTKWTAGINCPDQGLNKIYVKAVDEAATALGESNHTGVITNEYISVYVDSLAPVVCNLFSVDGDENPSNKKVVNGKESIKFIVTAKDTEDAGKSTGVEAVKLTSVGTKTGLSVSAESKGSDKYEITISTGNIASGDVKVTVIDKLNKEKTFTLFSIEKDITAPVTTITPLKDAESTSDTDKKIDVNGEIVITGTSSDETELASVVVYYKVGTATVPADADLGTDTKWTTAGWTKQEIADGNKYSWSVTIDTTGASNDKKNLNFYVVAKDSAGNVSATPYSAAYETSGYYLYINQDSDRPKINFTNLSLSSKDNSDNYIWHVVSTLQGSVTDDDGNVTSVKAIAKTSNTALTDTEWENANNLYSKGTWEFSGIADGKSLIYFQITDAKGKTFTSKTSGLTGPKAYDSNGTECLGFTGKESEVLQIKVDTKAPTIKTLQGYSSDSDTYDSTKEIGNLSTIGTIGGVNYKYLYVVLEVSDDNGIKSVSAKLDTLEASANNNDAKIVSQDGNKTKTVVRFDLSKLSLDNDKRTESKKIEASVTDNANKTRSAEDVTVLIDNKKPVVSFTTKNNSTIYGSIANTVIGKTTDGSNITSLQYKVTANDAGNNATVYESEWKEVAYSNAEENQVAKDNWSITFDDADKTTQTDFHADSFNKIYQTLAEITDADMIALQNNLDMYVHMKAVDAVGNASEEVTLQFKVVPNADKPTVEISYPTQNSSVGGIIRVTGSTSILQSTVSKVFIQIDPEFNGTSFNDNDVEESDIKGWEQKLTAVKGPKNETATYTIVPTGLDAPYNRAILANGTIGWSTTINSNHELEGKVGENYRDVAIRAFAVSASGRVSDVVTTTITMDPESPVFGNLSVNGYTGMRLVQYESGKISANQKYEDEMSIKGQWYLTGSISDSSGIEYATVLIPGNNTATTLISGGKIVKTDWVTKLGEKINNTEKYNYALNIPVGTTTPDTFGKLSYEVYIQDASDSNSDNSYIYTVSYDNKNPEFSVTTENKSEIVQSDGTYTIKGKYNEDSDPVTNDKQSGFERIVLYFTKELSGSTYIIDPMISNGTTGKANREAVSTLTKAASDGLYWRTATVSAINNGAITVTELGGTAVTEVEPKVRAGGLCKVDGIIYRIKAIDGATVQLNDTTVTNTSLTTVYFAAGALVIDNATPEGGNNTAVYDPAKSDSLGSDSVQTTAGDGDQMMETARTNGTETEWSVSIDSTQILDGNVKVNFVAYDKAGNKTDTVYAATVKNNAPRLAGVIYGSDLNNNGVIEGNEWYREDADQYVQVRQVSSSSNERANGKKSNGDLVTELTGTKRQTIKSDITVIPQVVGGNLGLDWTMTYRDNAGKTATTTSKSLSTAHSQSVIRTYGTDSSAANYKTANENSYKMSVSTLEFLQLNSNVGIDRRSGNEQQNLVFTITDKNEDTDNKASVQVTIPVKILFADGVAPTGKLKPFHWNSSSDNSLYNNSKAYGHIELPSDWKNGTTGYTDSIPKVSGIVTFEGEARDNVLVNQIAMKFGTGTQFTIATRGDSGWTSTHLLTLSEDDPETAEVNETKTYEDYFTASTDSWYFELVDDYTDEQNYNVVKFKFHWNSRTNLPGNVVALTNVPAQLVVTDKGSVGLDTAKTGLAYTNTKGNTVGTTQTTDATNTAYYKMDVVPYVAQVYTELAALKKNNDSEWSIASRTALGRYPVRVTTYNQSRSAVNNGGETINFYGFNLADATYTDNRTSDAVTTKTGTGTKLSTVEGFYDVRTLRADLLRGDDSNYSGPVVLKVNSINTINNANNNNAKGSYSGTLNNDTYAEAAYNCIPNDANNAALTDDLYFDVWQVNEGAARSNGRIEQPNMKVDPLTKKLGFAFIDSTFHFAMAGTTTKNKAPETKTTDNNSYTQWIRSVDFCTSAAFTYDSKGRTWGVTAGNESNTDKDDMLALVSSSWGANKNNYTYDSNINVRIGRTSQDGWTNNDKQRYKNPSMVSTVHSDRTSLYLAYYDNLNDEIRIQYGRMADSTTVSDNRDMSDIGSYTTADNATYDYLRPKVSVVAGDAKTTDDYKPATDKKAGEYLSIAVITSEGATLNDKLIIVWYDGSTLWYSINTDPDADYSDTTKGYRGSWSTPVRVFDEDGTMAKAGEYCRVAVDKNGGVHIAGYDQSNKDLCYAYLPANQNAAPTQQSNFVTRVVDSNGVTGSNISIDVGVDGSGNIVPHISYYSESLLRAKEAYYVGGFANNATNAILAGVDDFDNYTGAWEVSPVPTRRTLEMQSNQYNAICLGLWKNAGVIGNSTTGTDSNEIIWGNGTANPAVGYVTQVSSVKSCIEVAQKR